MPKQSNQKNKILYLAKILTKYTDEDHGLSMNEIIQHLDNYGIKAERKSIYDDLENLKLFGYDIEKTAGRNTKYYIGERRFELPEMKLLVDAVQSSKFITAKKSHVLIKKIEEMASIHQAAQLQRQVFVTNRIKTMNETIYYAVDEIHHAISDNKQITFQYYQLNEKKEKVLRHDGKVYRVSPWSLTWDDENYYLVAFDSDEEIIKHFRVDKMVNINVAEEARLGNEQFKNFDLALYSKKVFGMFSGQETKVDLICANDIAGAISDRFGTDIIICPYDDEHFLVTVSASVSPVFLTWLMNFGNKIKIKGPEWVIDQMVKLTQETLNMYR